MKNNNLTKEVIIVTIILLIGAGILPNINAYKSNDITNTNTDTIDAIIIGLVKNLNIDKYYNNIHFDTIICYYFQYNNGELTYKSRFLPGYEIQFHFESMKGFAFGIFIYARFNNIT